jgi:hypothetical protein
MSAQDARGPMILIWQACTSDQAKDLVERSDTGRAEFGDAS